MEFKSIGTLIYATKALHSRNWIELQISFKLGEFASENKTEVYIPSNFEHEGFDTILHLHAEHLKHSKLFFLNVV